MMDYPYVKESPYNFLETIDELRMSFAEEWFWVVSNLNISERVNKKLNNSFWNYVNLWFCNADIAYNYLSHDLNLWVFMPCTVSVYEKEWKTFISAGFPDIVIWWVVNENSKLKQMNSEITNTMKKVIDSLA